MRRRAITALLLFTLSGWAQTFALSDLHDARPVSTAKAPASTKPQGASHAHSHSCCPGLHGSYLLPMVVPSLPASLPCGDRHSCCVSRDSNNPPTVTANSSVERPDSRIASFDGIETGANHGFALARVCGAATLQSYSKLSTVLRI
jgi:hypothetical protein